MCIYKGRNSNSKKRWVEVPKLPWESPKKLLFSIWDSLRRGTSTSHGWLGGPPQTKTKGAIFPLGLPPKGYVDQPRLAWVPRKGVFHFGFPPKGHVDQPRLAWGSQQKRRCFPFWIPPEGVRRPATAGLGWGSQKKNLSSSNWR